MTVEKLYEFALTSSQKLFGKSKSQEEDLKDQSKYTSQAEIIKSLVKWHFAYDNLEQIRHKVISKADFLYKRVTISPDNKRLAKLDYDRNLAIYSMGLQEDIPIIQIKGKQISQTNIRFSFDSTKIAFYDIKDEEINIWDLEKKDALVSFYNLIFTKFMKKFL